MHHMSKMHISSNNNKPKESETTDLLDGIGAELSDRFIKKIYETIGQNVKNIRTQKNMSQLELSHAIGHKSVSVISCAEICYKNYHFNIEHLVKIANALDVKVSDFFIGVDEIQAHFNKMRKLYE